MIWCYIYLNRQFVFLFTFFDVLLELSRWLYVDFYNTFLIDACHISVKVVEGSHFETNLVAMFPTDGGKL